MPKSLGDLVKGRMTVIAKPDNTVLAVARRLLDLLPIEPGVG